VWFSEVSPRPHDTGLVTLCLAALLGIRTARARHPRPAGRCILRAPGASAVIYGGLDAKGIAFEGVADALAVPGSDLRLFGKPESFKKRRMGVAVANGDEVVLPWLLPIRAQCQNPWHRLAEASPQCPFGLAIRNA
jgi:phosphoribosylglycinamide formyltransferase 2